MWFSPESNLLAVPHNSVAHYQKWDINGIKMSLISRFFHAISGIMNNQVRKGRRPGLLADGEKIRNLRMGLGQSTAEIAEGRGFALRTLQRAETGKRISKGQLSAIADALNVGVDQIVVADSPIKGNNLELVRQDNPTGSKLYKILRDQIDELIIQFHCEPTRDQAQILKTLCNHFQEIQDYGYRERNNSDMDELNIELADEAFREWQEISTFFSPGVQVQAIGDINSHSLELEEAGITLYLTSFIIWTQPIHYDYKGPNGLCVIAVPTKRRRAIIVFSSSGSSKLNWDKGPSLSRESVFGAAIRTNLQNKVHPQDIEDWLYGSSPPVFGSAGPRPVDEDLKEFSGRYLVEFEEKIGEVPHRDEDEIPF